MHFLQLINDFYHKINPNPSWKISIDVQWVVRFAFTEKKTTCADGAGCMKEWKCIEQLLFQGVYARLTDNLYFNQWFIMFNQWSYILLESLNDMMHTSQIKQRKPVFSSIFCKKSLSQLQRALEFFSVKTSLNVKPSIADLTHTSLLESFKKKYNYFNGVAVTNYIKWQQPNSKRAMHKYFMLLIRFFPYGICIYLSFRR